MLSLRLIFVTSDILMLEVLLLYGLFASYLRMKMWPVLYDIKRLTLKAALGEAMLISAL